MKEPMIDFDNEELIPCITDHGLLLYYDIKNDSFDYMDEQVLDDELEQMKLEELLLAERDRSVVRILNNETLLRLSDVEKAIEKDLSFRKRLSEAQRKVEGEES